jgi:A/G-specific adenine glycosylase
VRAWYREHARDLPWRRPDTSPWGVLVSEVMLQQTPVSRVVPAYEAWLLRWPTPGDLAAASPGDAVRAWGRLGYPRRALRLHESSRVIHQGHGGQVPADPAVLRTLPGLGEYTAAAVAAFAYHRRVAVLDTNVRRVLSRVLAGQALPPAHLTRAERDRAAALLPRQGARATQWSAGLMELGALVCTAVTPQCPQCPLASQCRWVQEGRPAPQVTRRPQPFVGTDRQVRGLLLGAVRDAEHPVPKARLDAVWGDDEQRDRALASLVHDGLLEPLSDGRYGLPGDSGGRGRARA